MKEKGLDRKGKLNNAIKDKLQNYYGIAICQNKYNLVVQAAVKATLFHAAPSKDNSYHFPHYLQGKDSWCAYNQD